MGHNIKEDDQDRVFVIQLRKDAFDKYGMGIAADAVVEAFPEKHGFASVRVHAEIWLRPDEYDQVQKVGERYVPLRAIKKRKRRRR